MAEEIEIFDLNSALNAVDLEKSFQEKSRLQIQNFLPDEAASLIHGVLQGLDWRLVLNENGKHFDILFSQIEALGVGKTNLIVNAAKQRKKTQFQYLYKNYPLADMAASGNLQDKVLKSLYQTWNSQPVLGFLNQVTGAGADFCDMQATNYQAGHFLNHHDDNVAGKNRQFAYVYSLAKDWNADLGGQLEFFDDAGELIDSFNPSYNTLSIFSIPIMHQVTSVSEETDKERLSVTGWFRTR